MQTATVTREIDLEDFPAWSENRAKPVTKE
jgi:hypothetical protein